VDFINGTTIRSISNPHGEQTQSKTMAAISNGKNLFVTGGWDDFIRGIPRK